MSRGTERNAGRFSSPFMALTALRRNEPTSVGSGITSANTVIGRNRSRSSTPVALESWKVPSPSQVNGTLPATTSSGERSEKAAATAVTMFEAPGPPMPIATPKFRVERE